MFKSIKSVKLSVVLLAAAFLLIFLNALGWLRPFQNLAIRIISPVQFQIFRLGTGINNTYGQLASVEDPETLNKQLRSEVNKLIAENAELKNQIQELGQLNVQQNYLTQNKIQSVPARVIGKNPEPNLQAIILDRGSEDGIKPGQAIISDDGIMVGKISRVKSNTAEAILISDARSQVAAVILNSFNSKGVISGEHGLSLKMELIPQNEKLQIGDIVATSGLETGIPRGLAIGKVSRLEAESNSYFQTAWIQPLIRTDNLIVVSVITGQTL